MPRRPTPAKPATAGGGMTPTQVKVRRRWGMVVLLVLVMELAVFAIPKPQAPLNNANNAVATQAQARALAFMNDAYKNYPSANTSLQANGLWFKGQ